MSLSTIRVAQPHRIVRATVPLETPVLLRSGRSPFTVYNSLGEALETQTELCALASDNRSARIVEILAIDPSVCGGTYRVDAAPQGDGRPKLTPWAETQMASPPVFQSGSVTLATKWANDGAYTRTGDVCVTRRFYGSHVVGWVTAYAGEDFVEVAFELHNAEPGSARCFFPDLRIIGDDSDGIEPLVPEPGFIGRQLIPARSDGNWHYLRQRQVRQFRFLLHRLSADVSAMAYARGAGFGVSDQWTKLEAWGPGSLRLPSLPAPMLNNMRGWLTSEWARIRDSFVTGAAIDLGLSLQLGRIGIGHTTGSSYGGVTGGGGRTLYDPAGVKTALTGEPAGLRALHGTSMQIAYRMPMLLDAKGRVCELEDWLDSSGAPRGGWAMSAADCRFDSAGGVVGARDGAFGFHARRFEVPTGITFDVLEETQMAGIAPVDYQHYVRASDVFESLALLSNDPMAKHTLRGLAEAHRMSMRTSNRLEGEAAWIDANPGRATSWGRGHGHGYDAQAMAYLFSGRRWRERRAPELRRFADAVIRAQASNGCVQSTRGHKGANDPPMDGLYGVQASTEATIVADAVNGIITLLDGSPRAADAFVVRCAVEGFALYHEGASGPPMRWVAVNGKLRTDPPFSVSPVSHSPDHSEVAVVYGLALLACKRDGVTPPPPLVDAIKRNCGNAPDPRAWMLNQSFYNLSIDDRLALLTALESYP